MSAPIVCTRRELVDMLKTVERMAVEVVALGRYDWSGLPDLTALIRELWRHKESIDAEFKVIVDEVLSEYGVPAEDDPARMTIPQGSLGSAVLTAEYEAFGDGGAIEVRTRINREAVAEIVRDQVLEGIPCA